VTHARVALVTTFYAPVLGGSEEAARQLATVLARRGHAVRVITRLTDPAVPRNETADGVTIERVGPPVGRRGFRKWTFIPYVLAALLRGRATFDVICVVDYRGIGIAAVLAGILLRLPVVLQAQTEGVLSGSNLTPALARVGLRADRGLGRALSWPLRRIYRSGDAYACISRTIRAEALAEGIAPSRVHDLPNTVDTKRFRPAAPGERAQRRNELGWPHDRVVAIFVGRLSREKGVADLLEAWGLVASPAMLVIVGPDMPGHAWDEGPRVREVTARPPLAGRVVVFGAATDPAPLYRAADLAIVPSHWESFGISAAEAMASGLPVVASAVGGLTDYIVDGENGLLVPPRDPAALARAIDRVVSAPEIRARLGAAARISIAAYDRDVVLERFGALLDALRRRV
jgi:glycosyltransferase involved in cell wall biosynthesis